jgi:hypothetical protein
MALPKKATERIAAGLKKFQPVVQSARTRDINESDTVVILTDMLCEIFGYDKYSEISSEHMIRSTFCDLSIKLNGELELLIEAKAIGIELKDIHVKQAVDYAANQGCDWVVLTNGACWRVYHVLFKKPIEHELVVSFDILTMSHRAASDIELLGLLAKEGWAKAHLGDYHTQKQALGRFALAAMILSDPVLDVLRREIRRVAPEVKVTNEEISAALRSDVIKREVMEGDKADQAKRLVSRAAGRALRNKESKSAGAGAASVEPNFVVALKPEE